MHLLAKQIHSYQFGHDFLLLKSPSLLSEELDKLRDIFISKGYPLSIIDRYMQHMLRDRQVFFGPKKYPIYLKVPWLGDCSTRFDN